MAYGTSSSTEELDTRPFQRERERERQRGTGFDPRGGACFPLRPEEDEEEEEE